MSKLLETSLERRVRLQKEAINLVRSGYSFNQAAERTGVSNSTIAKWAKEVGVLSPAGSRWSDFSHRAPLAKKVRAAGGTWRDVADAWASVEGFVGNETNAWSWTRNNAPEIIDAGKGKRPAHVRRAVVAACMAGSST